MQWIHKNPVTPNREERRKLKTDFKRRIKKLLRDRQKEAANEQS